MNTHDTLEAKVANELYSRHGAVLYPYGEVELNGITTRVGLDFTAERTGRSNWTMGRLTGRTRITVGDWGGQKRGFRQKNDGTHSFDKIADALFEGYQDSLAQAKHRKERSNRSNNANQIQQTLAEELNIYDWTSMSVNKFGRLNLKFDSNLTEDNTRQLLKLAMELGVIKPKSS